MSSNTGAPATSRFGAVAFLPHFGSSSNRHIHYHRIVTDGVFSEGPDGEALFHVVTAKRTGDIWHVDLATVPTGTGFWVQAVHK